MAELKRALGTHADMTVFRKLRQLSYHSSYSHRGKYYTTDETARFDQLGLWSFRAVWFSTRYAHKHLCRAGGPGRGGLHQRRA